MRIALLSWRDTTHPDGGGAEVYLESVARELVGRGHRVTLRCARHPNSARRENRQGVVHDRAGGRLTVYPRALLWLVRHRRRYDVVVDVVNGLPFAAPLVRRRGVVALVHHLHREQWRIIYPGAGGRLGWFVESRVVPRLYRGCRFLTVSRSSAADLAEIGISPDAVVIAGNGLTSVPLDEPEAAVPTLCVLARLVPHKRIEDAFEVLARLRPDVPGLRLDVIGEGWWHEQLAAAAERSGVSDRITFHGHLPAADRDRLLGRAWLMLLPSVREGWGLAVTEAGAQGTPTVAYAAAGGVTESVRHGETGLLVHDLDEMVARTAELLRDAAERERLGRGARRLATSLTWTATTDVVERVLADAAGAVVDQVP